MSSLLEKISDVRSRLPLLQSRIALNHAGIAPQPLSRSIARFEQARAELLPSEALGTVKDECKSMYARMLNVDRSELAITRNTAEGVNIIAQGYPWKSGDRILTVNVEYPSNVYPWWNIRDRGVELDTVPERDGRVDYEELEAAIRPETKMLALSHVEFASGFAFDIDRLVKISRKHGLFLFLDIAQSIGAMPVDLSQIDAAAWPTWKWLMGPLGMGGFYLAKKHLETIRPLQVGSDGMIAREDYLDYNFEFRPDCGRFEYSTGNTLGALGTMESLAIFSSDQAEIFDRLLKNCDAVIEGISGKCELYSSLKDRSGILSFKTPGDPKLLLARLRENRIEAAVRGGRLRISPHFYNSEADLAKLIGVINAA